jgi:hypothetical protein
MAAMGAIGLGVYEADPGKKGVPKNGRKWIVLTSIS